ncbi:MAG: hypothetical protein LBN93_04820 [Candidatus Symbiothrix sp.]|nr:hypothetical protein [Candidatus Symbiothrix sp.]
MKKTITQVLALVAVLLMSSVSANAQNYDWNFSNNWAGATAGYSESDTVDGLYIYAGTGTNMGAITAGAAEIEGVSYTVRFQFNGAGYSGANATDAVPTVNMPTQRYVSFPVNGNVKVDVVGTTGSSSSDRKIFLTDGTNLIGEFVYAAADGKLKRTVNYTGGAATLYLFCNAACNIYEIIVTGGSAAVSEITADKAVVSVTRYDVLGRQIDANYEGLVIEKTVYDDHSVASRKIVQPRK